MTKNPESSKGQQKNEQKPQTQREDRRETTDFQHSTIESMLAAGEADSEKLASLLDKADTKNQERLVERLGKKRGNRYIQRMLAHRLTFRDHIGERTDEESTARHSPEEWASFASAAKAGAQAGFTNFQTLAHMTGVVINGPIAIGGRLIGPSIGPQVFSQVLRAGALPEVASAFGNAAGRAWRGWLSKVNIPGLPMYPSFAAIPAPMAPPTPGIPLPLLAVAPGAMINADSVTSFIIGALRDMANEPGAQEAADNFGTSLSLDFLTWLATKTLMNLLGKGPVPSFAPPYVPAGPVVMGDVIQAPGIIF